MGASEWARRARAGASGQGQVQAGMKARWAQQAQRMQADVKGARRHKGLELPPPVWKGTSGCEWASYQL